MPPRTTYPPITDTSDTVVVLDHGKDPAGRGASRGRLVAVGALHVVPPEVEPGCSRGDDIDLLPGALPDVADVEQPLLEVERPAPRVAQPIRPDLLGPTLTIGERVVGRDAIAGAAVHIDAEHRAEQACSCSDRARAGRHRIRHHPGPSRDSRRDRRRARHRCGWRTADRPREAIARCRRRRRSGSEETSNS